MVFLSVSFFYRLKIRILADKHLMSFDKFRENLCFSDVFCTIDLNTETVNLSRQQETSYYIKKS